MENREICHEYEGGHGSREKADSQHIDIIPERIPQAVIERLARPLLSTIKKAFQDPAVAMEYRKWKAERQKKQQLDDCQK
jgi:hypothetical protein